MTVTKRAMTSAERQERWRKQHLESADGEKESAHFVFEVGTKKRLAKIAAQYGYKSSTALIERWAKQTVSEIDDATERAAKAAILRKMEG